VNKNKPKITN